MPPDSTPSTGLSGVVATSGDTTFPGSSVSVGDTIDSVIDEATKPYEIFNINLTAGQELKFKTNFTTSHEFYLVPPGNYDIDTFRTSDAILHLQQLQHPTKSPPTPPPPAASTTST